MLRIRCHWEKGILPDSGALHDQHPLVIAALDAILAEEGSIQAEERRELERNRRR
jgi:hypothetical protein